MGSFFKSVFLIVGLSLGLLSASPIGNSLIGNKAADWPEKRVDFPPGFRQSPIDLNTKFVISKDLPTLNFINHDTDSTFYVLNTGHSAKLMKNDTNCRPAIVGGPLREPYLLEQIHFHWDKQNGIGSEHSIDGYKYSVEAHAVYFNARFRNFETAMKKPDGLAVVAFFIEEGSRPEAEIDQLIQGLGVLGDKDSKGVMPGVVALGWADQVLKQREYYTYPGSLTTPPYSETVTFIIFPYPTSISKKSMSTLRSLKSGGKPIYPNWREIQPLNKRLIVHSYNHL